MKSYISRKSPHSLYFQIQEIIREEYLGSDKPPGTKIPSERELIKRFKVARGTIRKAIDGLQAADLIYRVQGQGAFKRASADITLPINDMVRYADVIASYGKDPGVEFDSVYRIPATHWWMEQFNLSEGDELVQMKKIYTGDGEPVIYLINTIPVPVLGEELAEALCKDQSLAEPVFGFLANSCGRMIEYFIAYFRAELAGSCPFPIKTFPPDTLCQVIDNIGIDDHERPVHRSVLYMPEGGIHLQMIRKVPPQALDW